MGQEYKKNSTEGIFIGLPCNAKCLFCNTEYGFARKFGFINLRKSKTTFKNISEVQKELEKYKIEGYENIVYESDDYINLKILDDILRIGIKLNLKQKIHTYFLDENNMKFLDRIFYKYSIDEIDFSRKAYKELKEKFGFNYNKFIPLKLLLQKIKNAYDSGVECIIYEGGDFSIYPHIFEALKFGQKLGLKQTFQTNGIRLAEKTFVEKLKKTGIKEINFSLHAYREEVSDEIMGIKGVFRKTLQAISNCTEIGITVSQNIVITNKNIGELEHIIFLSLKLKINLVSFILFIPPEDKLRAKDTDFIDEFLPDPIVVGKKLSKMLLLLQHLEEITGTKKLLNIKFHNIPICLLDNNILGSREYIFDIFRIKDKDEYSKGAGFFKKKECKNCDFYNGCTGITEYYIYKYGKNIINIKI